MKINNFVKKSGLAIAISAMSVSAFAGVHEVTQAGGANILADEIFGNGSEDTLVAVPTTAYVVGGTGSIGTPGPLNSTDRGIQAAGVTVKFTLDAGAVFGEDLSDITKWAISNATLSFTVNGNPLPLLSAIAFGAVEVDQGGAIGDNTVTFKLIADGRRITAGQTLDRVDIGQFRVKNLTGALQRGVNDNVRLGAEFRNLSAAVDNTDTQAAVVVLGSQKGVDLAGTLTSYEGATTRRARIDVANSELNFTGDPDGAGGTGAGASQDFDETNNVSFVELGALKVVRTTYNAGASVVKKENGDDFDFQGSDQPVVTISSTADLGAYSSIALVEGTSCIASPANIVASQAPVAGSNSVDLDLSGETTVDLNSGYTLCAYAGGTDRLPESTFSAELNVTYFNPRYTDSEGELDYGPVLRNGCQVTLFNLPNVGAPDNAFIRLTNVSEVSGGVRAFIWTEDGQAIDINSELVNSLDAHATTVLHTNSDLAAGVFLGDVMPTYGATTSGRHRLVVQGAFPACEALGLIRSPNGTLTNMTSTTYSGDDSRLGTEQSNTSNTSN